MTSAPPPRPLRYGEPLALVHAASNRNPRFALGSLGGRWVLLCVVADLAHADAVLAACAAAPEEAPDRLTDLRALPVALGLS